MGKRLPVPVDSRCTVLNIFPSARNRKTSDKLADSGTARLE